MMTTFPGNVSFFAFAIPIEQGESKGLFLAAFSIGSKRYILNNDEFETEADAIDCAIDVGMRTYSKQVLQDALHNNDE